jgi:hypothetical protein
LEIAVGRITIAAPELIPAQYPMAVWVHLELAKLFLMMEYVVIMARHV